MQDKCQCTVCVCTFYDITLTVVPISMFIKLNLTLSALFQTLFKYQIHVQYHLHIFDAYNEHVSVCVHDRQGKLRQFLEKPANVMALLSVGLIL